jgi:hypothetical protein
VGRWAVEEYGNGMKGSSGTTTCSILCVNNVNVQDDKKDKV